MVNTHSLNSFTVSPVIEKAPEGLIENTVHYVTYIPNVVVNSISGTCAKIKYTQEFFGELGRQDAIAYCAAQAPHASIFVLTKDGQVETNLLDVMEKINTGVIKGSTYLWQPGFSVWVMAQDMFPVIFQKDTAPNAKEIAETKLLEIKIAEKLAAKKVETAPSEKDLKIAALEQKIALAETKVVAPEATSTEQLEIFQEAKQAEDLAKDAKIAELEKQLAAMKTQEEPKEESKEAANTTKKGLKDLTK